MARPVHKVVIIGGGAAGAAAALAAASEGAQVSLVRCSLGATALSSGAVDLAGDALEVHGDPWAGRPALEQLLATQRRLEPTHPLTTARLTAKQAGAALARLARDLPLLSPVALDRPPLVLPTDLGTFKSTGLAQVWQAGGHLPGLAGKRVGVVGLAGYPRYSGAGLAQSYAHLAAAGGVQLELVPLTVRVLRRQGEHLLDPSAVAARVEQQPTLDRLAAQLQQAAQRHQLDHLFLPPVMGLRRWQQVWQRLSAELSVSEVLASPPSVPGLRLQQALDRALERGGVRLVQQRAVGFESSARRVTALRLHDGAELEAGAFVLATGKFIGGGLRHEDALREPLFDLPVTVGGEQPSSSRYLGRYMHRGVAGPHQLMLAGLEADAALRPLDRGRRPAWDNLFGAGSVLGGYDYISGRSGLGTALITGHLAGTHAAAPPEGGAR